MKIFDNLHEKYVHRPRVSRLLALLTDLVAENSTVLDVGCGDGLLSSQLMKQKSGVTVRGVDVLLRKEAYIEVQEFNGTELPFPDKSFDYVMFVDVLHHTLDPSVLLREAVRVMRRGLIIKDHLCENTTQNRILQFMDGVGNKKHSVALPYNYWSTKQWQQAFRNAGIEVDAWNDDLKLYPAYGNWLFGRHLHYVARLIHA